MGRFTCSATHLFERVDEVWIFRFRDGRIVHMWSLEDALDRRRQLALTDLHG